MINYNFGEWLGACEYESDPFPFVRTQTSSIEDVNKEFEGLEFSDNPQTKSILQNCFPEEYENTYTRFLAGFEDIKAELQTQQPGNLHVQIVLAHGIQQE